MISFECDPDKVLVKVLGIPRKERHHGGGKGAVCKKLRKSRNSKGLVDEDPSSPQPTYIQRLKPLSHEHDIKLLYDESVQNYVIVLCPRLEGWILKAAREARIDVKKYGLPDEENELHKVINTNLEKFIGLIEEMKEKSSRLRALGCLIKSK